MKPLEEKLPKERGEEEKEEQLREKGKQLREEKEQLREEKILLLQRSDFGLVFVNLIFPRPLRPALDRFLLLTSLKSNCTVLVR